jgi:hypothetical protein
VKAENALLSPAIHGLVNLGVLKVLYPGMLAEIGMQEPLLIGVGAEIAGGYSFHQDNELHELRFRCSLFFFSLGVYMPAHAKTRATSRVWKFILRCPADKMLLAQETIRSLPRLYKVA